MIRNRLVRMAGAIAVAAMLLWALGPVGDASAADARPFKGEAGGVMTAAGGFAGSGTIIATHLGKGTVVFSGIGFGLPSVGNPGCFDSVGGTQTFTAANGDTLEMEYVSGLICVSGFPLVTGSFTVNVTGGSGRFDGATGTIEIEAAGDLSTGTWNSVLNGSISY